MVVTLLAVVIGLVLGAARGGRVAPMVNQRLGWGSLLAAGVFLQLAADRWDLGAWASPAQIIAYGCLIAFAARNLVLVGMGVVMVGLLANAVVVTVDAGMPVRPASVLAAGVTTPGRLPGLDYGYRHHAEGSHDHLTWLGDIVPVRPLHEVVSFGDLILAVGLIDVVARAMQPTRRTRRYRRQTRSPRPDALRARRLQVAVESVEHRSGNGFWGGAPRSQPTPGGATHPIAQDNEGASAELGAKEVHRYWLERRRQLQLAESPDHRRRQTGSVVDRSLDHRSLALASEMDLHPVGGGHGHDHEDLNPELALGGGRAVGIIDHLHDDEAVEVAGGDPKSFGPELLDVVATPVHPQLNEGGALELIESDEADTR
ncbi:MAG: DUF5317 family protein [Actinomycetota bacterium]|nr:DUF5317 family protein [Actinomycetota bacterium]